MKRRKLLAALSAAPLFTAPVGIPSAWADDKYPSRPVRLLIGYGAGGTADLASRILFPLLSERIGQQVVVDNRPGAGGIVASQAALAAPPDGYNLLLAATGNFGISPVLMQTMPFDTVRDLPLFAQTASFGYTFAVSSGSPFRTIADVIDYGRKNPGKLNIGTVQVGSAQFFAAELFKSMAGVQAVTVSYRTSGDVIAAARSGDVQLVLETLAPVMPHARAGGALRMLATTDEKRMPLLPDVPTVSESGLPGYVVTAWHGLAVRAGTPVAITDYLSRELSVILQREELQQKFFSLGIVAKYGDAKTVQALQQEDLRRWGGLMNSLGLKKQ